jgi:hypothetical protein
VGLIRGDGPFSLWMLGIGDALSVVRNRLAQRVTARGQGEARPQELGAPAQPPAAWARAMDVPIRSDCETIHGIALACFYCAVQHQVGRAWALC